MATKTQEPPRKSVREANRQLRLAIEECQALLKRTEEMLRESEQDNYPAR